MVMGRWLWQNGCWWIWWRLTHMSYKEVCQKVVVLYTTVQLYEEKTGEKQHGQCGRRHKCMCECVSGRRTRGASRRSAGCCQKRSCPSLSCLLGFLWLPAWTWNPERERESEGLNQLLEPRHMIHQTQTHLHYHTQVLHVVLLWLDHLVDHKPAEIKIGLKMFHFGLILFPDSCCRVLHASS